MARQPQQLVMKLRKKRLTVFLLTVGLAGLLAGCSESVGSFSPPNSNTGVPTPTSASTAPARSVPSPTAFAPKSPSSAVSGLSLSQLYSSPAAPGHTGYVFSTIYSPDGKIIASAGQDRTIQLWDATTAQPLAALKGHAGAILALAFSPDDRILASGDEANFIRLWDMTSKKEISTLTGHSWTISALAFSADGQTLASGSTDQTVRLWRRDATGKFSLLTTLKGHTAGVSSVAFSPDGKTLTSGSGDHTIKIWDLSNFSVFKTFENQGANTEVGSVTFSPDGKLLVSGNNGVTGNGSNGSTVKGWSPDPKTGNQPLFTLTGSSASIAFSPDGKLLAGIGPHDKTILLWEVNGFNPPKLVRKFNSGTLIGATVVFSPDGQRLVSQGDGYSSVVWEIASGREVLRLKANSTVFQSLAVSPDGKTLATGTNDKSIRLFGAAKGDLLKTLAVGDSSKGNRLINWLAYSPDGKTLASAGQDGQVRLWDQNQQIASLDADSQWFFGASGINMATYSPDGRWLASASADGTIKIWDAVSRNEVKTLRGGKVEVDGEYYPAFEAVAFSPGGKTLASIGGINPYVGGFNLQLWKAPDGLKIKDLGSWDCHLPLLFTVDGQNVGCLTSDNIFKLWNVNNGKLTNSFAGHNGHILSAAFSPDGNFLVSAAQDGTIRLWETATGAELYRTDPALTNGTVAIAFGPDNLKFFSAQVEGSVQAWKIQPKTGN